MTQARTTSPGTLLRQGPDGTTILRVTGFRGSVPRHVHASLSLGVIISGARDWRINGQTLRLGRGDAFLIPPETPHAILTPSGHSQAYVILSLDPAQPPAGLENEIRTLSAHPGGLLPPGLGPFLIRLASDPSTLLLRAIIQQAAATPPAPQPASPPEAPATSRALKARLFIEANFASPLTLSAIAAAAGVTPFHLTRLFTTLYGLPPHVFLTLLRLRQARRLLTQGLPPAETALAVGFYDQSHLTNAFRRYQGLTPSRYAHALRQGPG